MKPDVAILTGPTATGKSSIAHELALRHGGIEIINADSLLIYRGMDIGTAKPTREELNQVPYQLIDIRDPGDQFTAGDFVSCAFHAIDGIHSRSKRALIVGGTGFYLKALLFGLWQSPKADPALRAEIERLGNEELLRELHSRDGESALRIGPNDRYRLVRAIELIRITGKTPTALQALQPRHPNPRFSLWIIDRPTETLDCRINLRIDHMISAGLIEETAQVRSHYPHARALKAVGYAQVCDYLDHVKPDGRKIAPGLAGLKEEIQLATRQLMKKQRTWFRGQRQARKFELDQDRRKLEKAFHELYG